VPLMTYHEIRQEKVGAEARDVSAHSAVFMKSKESVVALLVDKVEVQTDLVIKPFSKLLGKIQGFKGLSVLADEGVAYILNPDEIISLINPSLEEAA